MKPTANTIGTSSASTRLAQAIIAGAFALCSALLLANIPAANAADTDPAFAFRPVCADGSPTCATPAAVDLLVSNPAGMALSSVRAQLGFNPGQLSVSLNSSGSDFPLAAPGEDNVDAAAGRVMIGRSLLGGAQKKTEFFVARLGLSASGGAGSIRFLEQDPTINGIFVVGGTSVQNIMGDLPNPFSFGMAAAPVAAPTPAGPPPSLGVPTDAATEPPPSPAPPAPDFSGIQIPSLPSIPRPQNFYAQTDASGAINFLWEMDAENPVASYQIWYGSRSGAYLRRRDVGLANTATMRGFPFGTPMYFALVAVSPSGQESDFSDEIRLIPGHPGSESHRFLGDPLLAAQTPSQTLFGRDISLPELTAETGPIVLGIVGGSLLGAAGLRYASGRRQQSLAAV